MKRKKKSSEGNDRKPAPLRLLKKNSNYLFGKGNSMQKQEIDQLIKIANTELLKVPILLWANRRGPFTFEKIIRAKSVVPLQTQIRVLKQTLQELVRSEELTFNGSHYECVTKIPEKAIKIGIITAMFLILAAIITTIALTK